MSTLPADLRHLYITWLDEESFKCQQRQQKTAMLLNNACRALQNHEGSLGNVPEELMKIKGIGAWTTDKLRKRLSFYCKEQGFDEPPIPEAAAARGGKTKSTDDGDDSTKKKRKTKEYVPKRRSGGYAVMLVLLEFDEDQDGITKNFIVDKATPYSDSSFTSNASTQQFYSAWNGVKKLVAEGLVQESGRPARYLLTDTGLEMAKKIKLNDNIVFRNERPPDSRANANASTQQESQAMMEETPAVPVHIPTNRVEQEYMGVKYFIWEAGTYDVKFIIDNREIRSRQERDFFSTRLSQLGTECVKRPLAVGDGLWIARHNVTNEEVALDYIFERKRLDDLVESIKDGRYTEQKSRLKRTGIKNVFYLIEEVTASDIQQMSTALETAISQALTVSNFHVQRTKDQDATLRFILRLTQQIVKAYAEKKLLVVLPHNVESQMGYSTLLNQFREKFETPSMQCVHLYDTFDTLLSKSKMMTVRELFVRMLMTVRGVTLEKAIAIQREFHTPKILHDKFDPKDPVFASKYGKKVQEVIAEVFGKK